MPWLKATTWLYVSGSKCRACRKCTTFRSNGALGDALKMVETRSDRVRGTYQRTELARYTTLPPERTADL